MMKNLNSLTGGKVKRIWAAIAVAVVGLAAPGLSVSAAQQGRLPPTMSVEEATALSQGWALLAQGLLAEAMASSDETLRRFPNNQAAVALVVEVAIARFGATAALDRYERWIGNRTLEDGYTLRRVALATLWDMVRQPEGGGRHEAIRALMADGDREAAAELSNGMQQGNLADTQIMAALGSGEAVQRLVNGMNGQLPLTIGSIKAMGDSGHALAAQPLVGLLKNARPEFRAAAARGLGQLQVREAAATLRGLLNDMHPDVRLQASAALWQMDDGSGLAVLRQFEDSEYPAIRLAALQATSAKRDASWASRATALLQAEDPMVRVQAASLVAQENREAARQALEALSGHENIAVREVAERAIADVVANDLTALRGLLRNASPAVRVSAADRLLKLAR